MKEITSLTNEQVKLFASLNTKKYRDSHQLFIIDGDHLVLEALKYGLLETVIFVDYLPNELKSFDNLIKVTPEILKKISNVETPKNIVGICHYKKDELSDKYNQIIALDNVQDPGNGGTILRSALAFNYDCMLLSENSFDMYNPKFIRSTMGAFFALPIIHKDFNTNLTDLKNNGYEIYAGDLTKDSIELSKVKSSKKHIIVVGNEGNGLSKETKALANKVIIIPISDKIDSLNVGVAASLLMQQLNNC